MDQIPFQNASSPLAQKLVDYAMSGDDNSVAGAIHHHQAVLLAIAGAISLLEARVAELESKITVD